MNHNNNNTNPSALMLTRPFTLTMQTWKNSPSPLAGSNAASALASWGDLYGGDLDHAPTIREFNIALESYAHCSRGDYGIYQDMLLLDNNDNEDTSSEVGEEDVKNVFPAELSWDIYTFLKRMTYDVTLLPNVQSCSHMIHSLANDAFVMKYANRNKFGGSMNNNNNNNGTESDGKSDSKSDGTDGKKWQRFEPIRYVRV